MAREPRTYRTGRIEKLGRILAADAEWSLKLRLLGVALSRRSRGDAELQAGPVSLLLSRDERDVDWRIVLGIFVDGDYATDYRDAAVIDVGAHKGFFGAFALSRGASSVVSYEPSSSNYAALERAAASVEPGKGGWRTFHAAVGAEAGEAALYLAAQSWQNTLLADAPQATERTEQVAVVPMTAVLREAAVPDQHVVVKVDAEGYECQIIPGTPPEAWSDVDELFVEVEDSAPCSPDVIVEHLENTGLRFRRRTAPDVLHFARDRRP